MQKKLKVRIKRLHKDRVLPCYSKKGDAGLDLTAVSIDFDNSGNIVYGTGLAVEIPKGFVGLLFPRSSNAKKDLFLTNSVGVIDSGYRGEIMLKFKPSDNNIELDELETYSIGDRVGQLIILPYPNIEFEEVNKLSETDRGVGGYGSTGT